METTKTGTLNNRKKIKIYTMKKFRISLFIAMLAALCSCSKEGTTPQNENNGTKVYKLTLNVNHNGYDQTATKGDNYQWPDGAKLYIIFSNKDGKKEYAGTATYSKSTNAWTIPAPEGELHRGDSTACKVLYINKTPDGEIITLTTDDVIYSDYSAKYFLGTETLTITANLSPHTARVRFKGDANTKIKVYGTAHYNKYNTTYNTFGTSDSELELTVKQDGYTPYVHVYFPNNAKQLELTDSNNKIFIFKCSNEDFVAGASTYFDIPTTANTQGWRMYDPIRTFKVKDVEFKMIFVQDINGSFYMAETETTQKLWYAVTNEKPFYFDPYIETKDTLGNVISSEILDLPAENMSLNQVNAFFQNLRYETGQMFSLPTFAQWLHAAKGGNKSHGYAYSGSDTLDVVAHTGSSTAAVKSKKTNELGLYDMSGNISEFTVQNPGTIPSDYGNISFYFYGGHYKSCPKLSSEMSNDYRESYQAGLRICLNI